MTTNPISGGIGAEEQRSRVSVGATVYTLAAAGPDETRGLTPVSNHR
ncbi:hypothetical protein ACH9L7_16900 (plasmid) [Haloferax sp. S1W]